MDIVSRLTAPKGIDPWYVTGFVEGYGTFSHARTDRNLAIHFGLKLSQGHLAVLEDIQAFFGGIGSIYHLASRAAPHGGGAKGARLYRVGKLAELDLVVTHFDDYPLRGPKAASYRIWREIFALKRDSFRKPDRERLHALAAALSACAERNQPWQPE